MHWIAAKFMPCQMREEQKNRVNACEHVPRPERDPELHLKIITDVVLWVLPRKGRRFNATTMIQAKSKRCTLQMSNNVLHKMLQTVVRLLRSLLPEEITRVIQKSKIQHGWEGKENRCCDGGNTVVSSILPLIPLRSLQSFSARCLCVVRV
jgi:hypothetical protein